MKYRLRDNKVTTARALDKAADIARRIAEAL